MWVTDLTNLDIVLVLFVAVAVTGLAAWLVPGVQVQRGAPKRYSGAEITAYDRKLPIYALFGAGAMLTGALHGVLKNLPGAFQWLLAADHGGEMAKDLSNTHIFVVGVGTVLLTGLTWYVLPRIAKRPLFSPAMATASFWFTALGVTGFYVAWLILGVIEGRLVHQGIDYATAKAMVGKWHSVPLRATGMLLGLGYWTYGLNTVLTAWFARRIEEPRPHAHLIKFVVTGTLALTVGTVQGVLQVLPDNETFIQAAGPAGRMIDPVSHAHVNLVLGAAMLTIAFFAFLAPRLGLRPIGRGRANAIFWVTVPGGLLFYLSLLGLGLFEGRLIVGAGMTYEAVVARLGILHSGPIMVGGIVMTAGVWLFLVTALRSAREAPTAVQLAVVLACVGLFFGTLQGPLQAIEGVKAWYHAAGALGELVPSAHAQLNILGGLTPLAVLLALAAIPRLSTGRLAAAVVWLESGAMLVYTGLAYVGVRASLLAPASATPSVPTTAPGHAHPLDPAVLRVVAPGGVALGLLGFTLFSVGAVRCFRLVWRHTAAYRARTRAELAAAPARMTGPVPKGLERLPRAAVLGIEAFGGLMGFPGFGWILTGRPFVGWPLAAIGPGVAWALLPVLFNPLQGTLLSDLAIRTYLYYLPGTAFVSTSALAVALWRENRSGGASHGARRTPPAMRRYRRMVALGASVLIVALLSTALVPLLGGSVGARAGYTPLETVPAASRGVFFGADGAFVRPYPWHVAPSDYPPDSLTIRDVETILVQEKRAGDATDYRLVDLTDAHRYPLAEVSRARVGKLDQLVMAPREPLPAGRYLLIADQTASMYGGTVEYFFSVDAATAPLSERLPEPPREAPSASAAPAPPAGAATPAAEEPTAGEPAPGADRLWSGLAALSAVLLAGFVWLDYRRKPAPHRMWWALGVTMFAVASSMGLLHALRGAWEPLPYRLWYLAGALLAAAFLGHGTAWLVLPRRVAKALTWILVLYTGAATALALAAPLALANLGPGDQLSGRALPEIAGALAATPRFHTIFLNSYGAAFLVLGALWSAWRMRGKPELLYRVWGTISIAAGGMAMGAVGTLNRFGFSGAQSLGEVVAIALIFAGFKLAAMQREVPATRRGSEASPRYAVAGRGTNP